MRHTCAYDELLDLAVFTDAGGSQWYDRKQDAVIKHTWLYDPQRRCWLEPIEQPFPGGGTVSPIAVTTPKGVIVYQKEKMYRFTGAAGQPDTWSWEEIQIEGPDRPRQHEFMTIVYDFRCERLIMLSEDEQRQPQLWFFCLHERTWKPNPRPAPGGVVTREAVYVVDADAILAYGPAKQDDPVWTRAYLCCRNQWLPLKIDTPQYIMHEVALEYDWKRNVAVLLWPPRFEQDIRPHLLRLNTSKVK
jgi:hypothetical protein